MADDSGESSKSASSSSSLTRHRRDSKISRFSSSPGDFFSHSLDSLPEPLLLEILIRLPCKSCYKCKCVSKRWGSLISDSYFIRRYIYFNCRATTKPRFHCESDDSNGQKDVIGKQNSFPFTLVSKNRELLLTNPVFNSSGFSLGFLPCYRASSTERSVFVVASSKDLLLCSSSEYYVTTYFICNPLTQQFIRLPNAPRRIRRTRVGFIVEPFYHFNGDRDMVDLNYGYRYLVVRFVFPDRHRSDIKVEIATYDSELGKWEVSLPDNPDLFSYDVAPSNVPILANCGMLHWWSYHITRFGLVSFDPLKKNLILRAKPEDMEDPIGHGKMVSLGSCQGRIHVCQFLRSEVDPVLSVWELHPNLRNWQLLHRVWIKDMNTSDQLLAKQIRLMKPTPRYVHYSQDVKEFNLRRVLIHPDDQELLYIVFDTCFALYNIHTMTLSPVAQISPQQYFLWQPGLLFPLHLECLPTPINTSQKRRHCPAD